MGIEPEGEDLRKATRWISDERLGNQQASLGSLVEEACIKFNLSPKDADFLMRFFTQNGAD